MPTRISVETHITTKAQGDDSWVKIIRPTVGQMKAAQKLAAALEKSAEGEEAKNLQTLDMGLQVARDCVIDWNWVDSFGKPLPQVPTNPEVIDQLTDLEIVEIMKLFNPDEVEAKNSEPASLSPSGQETEQS